MSHQVIRLTANDYEEAIDFLNLIFSLASQPTDFPSLLPVLYRRTEESMGCNFAVRKNGRIRAISGVFPKTVQAGGRILLAGGIGGVSVHPGERNSGLMREVLEACQQEMQTLGMHLSCLGGLRQRYGYYGYEKAGSLINYTLTPTNLKHCFANHPPEELHYVKMTSSSTEWLSRAMELHCAQPFYSIRASEDFFEYLTTWKMTPWAALDKHNQMVGYLTSDKMGCQINEILADNPEFLHSMIHAWLSHMNCEATTFHLAPWNQAHGRVLGSISESVIMTESYNWRIFDWVQVITALMEVKAGYSPLCDGTLRLGIEGCGVFEIIVDNGRVHCGKTDAQPDLECSSLTATRLLFGPLAPPQVMPIPSKLQPLLSCWLPLPLSWPLQDGI